MKHPFLVIMLLGFGTLLPSTCSKTSKQQPPQKVSYQIKSYNKLTQFVLCAPVSTMRLAQPRRA